MQEEARPSTDAAAAAEKHSVRRVYNALADEYDDRLTANAPPETLFLDTEQKFLADRVGSEDVVLDVGCGTGRLTLPLAMKARAVVGADLTPGMLGVAREKCDAGGAEATFVEADMVSLPFEPGSFTVVVSSLAVMHVPVQERQAVFCELARVLAPGGRLLLSAKNELFERMSKADRFVSMDVTDPLNEILRFTQTRSGEEHAAPWHSFTPYDLRLLAARAGLTPVELQGVIPFAAWIADPMLADPAVNRLVRSLEATLGSIAPINHFGYHLLFESVKSL